MGSNEMVGLTNSAWATVGYERSSVKVFANCIAVEAAAMPCRRSLILELRSSAVPLVRRPAVDPSPAWPSEMSGIPVRRTFHCEGTEGTRVVKALVLKPPSPRALQPNTQLLST